MAGRFKLSDSPFLPCSKSSGWDAKLEGFVRERPGMILSPFRCQKSLYLFSNQPDNLIKFFIQLRIEQRQGRVFGGWNEGKIYFPPTYKYSNNSDRYAGDERQSKQKRRTPAWYSFFFSFFLATTTCMNNHNRIIRSIEQWMNGKKRNKWMILKEMC